MKKINIILLIALCAGLQVTTNHAGQRSKRQSKRMANQLQKKQPQVSLDQAQEEIVTPAPEELPQQQSEQPSKNSELPSYWQSYAPQFMQDTATITSNYIASWIPQSVKDRVNSWSTRKKVAVASAIIGSLAAIYNRDQILSWVNGTLASKDQEPTLLSSTVSTQSTPPKQPTTPPKRLTLDEESFNKEKEGFKKALLTPFTLPNGTVYGSNKLKQGFDATYLKSDTIQANAYKAAVEELKERGMLQDEANFYIDPDTDAIIWD